MDHVLKCHDIVKGDFVRAENCYLWDSQGRRFTDFESGIWCTALGHRHPAVQGAMAAQMEQVAHLGMRLLHPRTEEAARMVLGITGMGDGACTFLSSGSEAVEFSVQAARRLSGRPLLLAFSDSYLAAYGSAGRKDGSEWLLFDRHLPDPLSRLGRLPWESIGAFVFEPGGSGSAFVKFPPGDLVAEIAHRVKASGGLLVANEVTSGMGRTGKWFGFQHYDLLPDIAALGKGLGNGYPVSASAVRRPFSDLLEKSGWRYVQSHQNDPLGCAAAVAVIEAMGGEGWVERGAETGAFFLRELQSLASRHPLVKEARGRGMLLALELLAQETVTVESLFRALLERGFHVGFYPAGRILRFTPALTMPREEISALIGTLDELLAAARI